MRAVVEASSAFLAGAVFFLLTDVIPIQGQVIAIVALGCVYIYVVLVAARSRGPLYAVPLAIAGGLGFDSFYIPPYREFGIHDWQNWLVVAIYVSMGVLIGVIGAHSQRRAEASERARGRLLEEQAALHRVATLVARNALPDEVFAAVAREVGALLAVDVTHIGRYHGDATITGIASWSRVGGTQPIGVRSAVEGETVAASVLQTGQPARIDSYDEASQSGPATMGRRGIRSSVGVPIVVQGRSWGVVVVSSKGNRALPEETEQRTSAFTELVATAISNANAQAEVRRLAEEQAALRRVATLVAQGSQREEIFAAIAEELGPLVAVDDVRMLRFDDDSTATVVASWGASDSLMPVGSTHLLGGESVGSLLDHSGRAAAVEKSEKASAALAKLARGVGASAAVAAPIVVEGRIWGTMVAASRRSKRLPPDTEAHLDEFTELMATAIANIQAHSELDASRARIVEASDEERRRVVRDLHDGAQQRLVHTVVTLKLAQRALGTGDAEAESLVAEALANAGQANKELRELAHGILPSVLTRGGLRAGVEALVSRTDLPVTVDVPNERFPAAIEASAYFFLAEALTNVMKHARAEHADVRAAVDDGMLHLEVRDDGIGGAAADGTGLVGLEDRLAALGGHLRINSPEGGGTVVEARLPLRG